MNRELLNNLYDIYDYLYIYNGYMELIGKFEKDTESCKQKYLRIKNEKISTFPIYLIIIFSAVILFIIGGLVASQINSYVIVYIIIGAVIFAFAAANRYSKKQKKEPEKKQWNFGIVLDHRLALKIIQK